MQLPSRESNYAFQKSIFFYQVLNNFKVRKYFIKTSAGLYSYNIKSLHVVSEQSKILLKSKIKLIRADALFTRKDLQGKKFHFSKKWYECA